MIDFDSDFEEYSEANNAFLAKNRSLNKEKRFTAPIVIMYNAPLLLQNASGGY